MSGQAGGSRPVAGVVHKLGRSLRSLLTLGVRSRQAAAEARRVTPATVVLHEIRRSLGTVPTLRVRSRQAAAAARRATLAAVVVPAVATEATDQTFCARTSRLPKTSPK